MRAAPVPRFTGFPSRPEYVAIPKVFFSDVLPHIDDPAELVVSLHLFRILGARRGYPRAVAEEDILHDRLLKAGFPADPARETARGLAAAVERGSFLRADTPEGGAWVLLNTEGDRRAAAAIREGRLVPSPSGAPRPAPAVLPERDIFTLYEEAIGVLTPIIAERLQEAEREYPPEWVREAFVIAEEQNQRRWRYVEAILRRWKTEGKDDGKSGRYPAARRVDYSAWLPGARGKG